MDTFKEFLLSKYFSSFGYVVAAFHVPALVTFAAVTGQLRTSERRTFRCNISDCRDDCLREYDEQFNSPIPLYGFALLSFVPLLVVCIAYSWCFVKSRVDEIEAAMKPDPENPRPRPRVTTKKVFRSYFIHLLLRFVLGILFTMLQNFVFYASDFPTEFLCVVCDAPFVAKPTKPTGNSTNFNRTKVDSSAVDCNNSVGSDYSGWAKGIWIVNVLFVLLVFGEMCYLLVRAQKSEEFTFDSEFCLKHFFGKNRTPVTLRDSTIKLKMQYRKRTEYEEPLVAPGDGKALDDIFVDLVIYTGREQHHKFQYSSKRHEMYDIYLQPRQGSFAIKNLNELLLANKDTQDPRKILILGRPGIGKSVLCRKLLRNLSKEEMSCDNNKTFEHVFLFPFRRFNSETLAEKISLRQLLNSDYPGGAMDIAAFQYILDNPETVLLVFDGLDEFKHHKTCLKDEQEEVRHGSKEEMKFAALYVKLAKGEQLPGATVLTTCRPNFAHSVATLKFDRTVEIMGFTPEKVQQYVQKHCAHNTQTMNKIWEHISSNPELLALCYIPANCHIICSLLEKLISLDKQDSGSQLPKTTTMVYTGALRLFIFKHHPEHRDRQLTIDDLSGNKGFSDSVEETLTKVGKLAKEGIESQQLVFESSEVQGMENCGLFQHLEDSEESPYTHTSHCCFIHLTLQEFLAAREIAKMNPSDLCSFISLNASNPKWQVVIQFVAGLLQGQENEALDTFVKILLDGLTRDSLTGKKQALLMLKCLQEANNDAAVKKAASELEQNPTFKNEIHLCHSSVTPVDCTAITYFAKHLGKPTLLDLSVNSITDQGVSHLCDALKHANCKLTQLDLSVNSITDQGVSHLSDALKHGKCKLTQLNLARNEITNQGVSHLCGALKHVNCKLNQLHLNFNSITNEGVSHLCDALKDDECKLTQFHVCGNSITDQGVSQLCDALKHVECKLTQLYLYDFTITDQGVSQLCDALKHVECKLTQLYLYDCIITQQGVSHLCDALKEFDCKLNQLYLGGNSITEQGASHLCDALKHDYCKLTQLDLNSNRITDQGVSHLCDALKDANCKLTQLNLSLNSITDQGASHLCDALKDANCKLTQLNLSQNSITDQGVSHLCDALKHVKCKLTQLDLSGNIITNEGVSHLCDALKHDYCKLTQLNLRENGMTDQSASHLCDALKDANCKLTQLDLEFNRITDQGVSHLCDALKHDYCQLTQLKLGRNSITDQGASHLCDALKHVNCKLTQLELYFNRITGQGYRELYELSKIFDGKFL